MRIVKLVLMCGFVLGVVFPVMASARKKITLRVEAETLVAGKWQVHKSGNASASKFLYGSKNTGPLKTSIKLPRRGEYNVWVRVRPGHKNRRGRVTVNGKRSSVMRSRYWVWKWYNLGKFKCSNLDLVLEGIDASPKDIWFDLFYITETNEPPGMETVAGSAPIWIWSKKKTKDNSAVYFRKSFNLPTSTRSTMDKISIRAGGPYVVYINGRAVGKGDNWRDFTRFDITKYLRAGKNLLAVSCRRGKDPGGLQVKLVSGGKNLLRSDCTFRVSEKKRIGWYRPGFNDSRWWGAQEHRIHPLRKLTVSEKNLFEFLNLDYPGLEKVKAAYAKGDLRTAREELLKHFRTRRKPNYFFDWRKKDEIVKRIKTAQPNYYDRHITKANSIMTHVFKFEGDKRDVGKDVNWVQDTPGGNKSYAQILSRFPFTALLSAYWATGDEKYAREYIFFIKDWIQDNPRPLLTLKKRFTHSHLYTGALVGWSALNTGDRLTRWVDAHHRLLCSPSLDADLNMLMLQSMYEQARYLYDFQVNVRRGGIGGNWLVVECGALLDVAVMFPEFKASETWRDKALSQLQRELKLAVYKDGGYFELNCGYQSWVMHKFFSAMNLTKKNNIKLAPEFHERYEKMFDYYVAISMPDVSWPMRGDGQMSSTGGKGQLLKGALLYGRADFKFLSGYKKAPLTYFMTFDADTIKNFRNLKAKKPAYTSIALPNSKHVIMRTGWDRDDLYLMLDCAPWGGGHTHWDHLHINVYAYGQLLLTDGGMGCYDDRKLRNFLMRTEGHNVVMIDGKEQPRHAKPPLSVETFVTTANFDFAQGLFPNYAGAKQLRSIIFLKPDYWIMVDRLDETKPGPKPKTHSVKQLFHFAPTILTTDETVKTVHSNYSNGNVLLAPAGANKVKLVEKQGWIGFTRSYTPKAPYVEYQRQGTFPMVMPLVIYPYPGKQCPPPITTKLLTVSSNGRPIAATQALCVKVEHEKTGTDYFILSWAKGKMLVCDGISSDGQAACIRYNPEGEITSAFLVGGKKITDKNGIVIESDKVLKKCDVKYCSNAIMIETDIGANIKVRPNGKRKIVVNGKEMKSQQVD